MPPAESSSAESPPSPAVRDLFGDRWPLTLRYADLLSTEGRLRGLLGPREVSRLWSRHLLNCAVVGPALPPAASVCDLGSGAGLPGIVLALVRPDCAVTLLEPLARRVAFLDFVIGELELPSVEVLRGRAPDDAPRAAYDVVAARAVAPLDRLAGWAAPLLRPSGAVLAWKGVTAVDEVAATRKAVERAGLWTAGVEIHGVGVVEPPATVVRLESRRA